MGLKLPKFIFGDNHDLEDELFIIHTEFPRFIYSDNEDEVEWIDNKDSEGFPINNYNYAYLINEAKDFLDSELEKWGSYDDFDDWKQGYEPTQLN